MNSQSSNLSLLGSPESAWQEVTAQIARRAAERQRIDVEKNAGAIRARCRSLIGFVCEAWKILEPRARYIHGWHIEAICKHLEAVTHGRVTRLLINVPPGSMKSLLVSVLWPAWEWGPCGMRSMRYLATAYNDTPTTRDTRKCRDLIVSAWYQALWPEVALVRKGETSFANSDTGTRESLPFGSLTSQRGDRLIIDDPHSTETAESEADREKTTRKFREGALDRLNDQQRSAIIVVMQRLHAKDISGVIQTLSEPYVHLCLPMRFESERRCVTEVGFADPREHDGELMCPEKWPRQTVDFLEADKGSYAFAGQYQQRPAPREGAMFKRHWFANKIIQLAAVPTGTRWVRHWDLAATAKKTAARTAGVKLGRTPAGTFVVGHVVTTQSEGNVVRGIIKTQADLDGKTVEISLPQDPGQAGKVQAKDFVGMLAGWVVRAEPETGDKETRAEPFSAQCEAGHVQIVAGAWNDLYLDELCMFPSGAFKDQVDATSGAFGRLIRSAPAQPRLSVIQV